MLRIALPLLLSMAVAGPVMAACQGAPGAGKVQVNVEAVGVKSGAGQIAFTVYPDSKGRFLKGGGKLDRVRVKAVAGTTRACFWLAPGFYPFAVYHDANGDRDFNRTLWMPKEGFAFSNNVPTSTGLPPFEKVRIRVGPNSNVSMRMRYP